MSPATGLVPLSLPQVEAAELAATHLPGIESCCDWYDAIRLPDGSVALVIADVVGSGDAALDWAFELRDALRARALAGDSPGAMLGHVNSLVTDVETQMATVLVGVYSPATGELRAANAAHPPALIRRQGGGVERWDAARSVPVGLAEPGRYPEAVVTLEPGEAVLLYTDGLIERRSGSLDQALAELEDAMLVFGSADGLRTAVLDAMLGGADPDDDVAVLALAIPPGG